MDLNSAVGRESGLTEKELEELGNFEESSGFSETEKRVLRYVTELSQVRVEVSDSLFEPLKEDFTTRQLVEITSLASWENYRARFNKGFDLQSQGFSKGATCTIPTLNSAD